ncbi:hypothetical protein E5676_scaffold83G001880 [Cucumis melo var. makuwa]|uniref:Gypsy/ty3 element polyprotein n=1 Tax=Cucumis melo var. makuwa TaxID=1194695 RepID=A0A5A7TQ66_CUCMM|nr:hypothetical protein E6C27_scaffold2741G00030 [Cucumis melo var. makuwa]TYK05482.1 hypothetical protein E5676_scaffold83G001880 [Cucumis melo var. makuwa]
MDFLGATLSVQLFLVCSTLTTPRMLGLLTSGFKTLTLGTIDPSSTFTVKSLMDDLVGSLDFQVKEVYSAFWMDHIPKTIKISFGNSA